jgi:hypothetical protein
MSAIDDWYTVGDPPPVEAELTIAPLAVWDPNLRGGVCWRYIDEVSKWAIEHLDAAGDIILAEFYLIDAPFAIVHRLRRNENGRAYTDPETGELAKEPPATVMLDELPPEHLRRVT